MDRTQDIMALVCLLFLKLPKVSLGKHNINQMFFRVKCLTDMDDFKSNTTVELLPSGKVGYESEGKFSL